eukprot:jgi/Botrbrau1/20187/Bobra.0173s0084.1
MCSTRLINIIRCLFHWTCGAVAKGGFRDCPVLVGSVKFNMGNCEGASRLAGLIKALLALEHGTLPSNLHFHTPISRAISRVIGINSFGLGGTDVHVLIGSGPAKASFQQKWSYICPSQFVAIAVQV